MPPRKSNNVTDLDLQIADLVASCYHDPLRFVMTCYPWGEPGPLEHHPGPDPWQTEILTAIGDEVLRNQFNGATAVRPVRCAVSSGHGIGKSTLQAWLVNWIMSTRPHAQGTITANTSTQLQTKTWASLQVWTRRCLTGHWFVINSERMYHPNFKESWFCTAQTCKEENSEAFAGQHAASSSSFYINDEDSAVPNIIHEVEEGGLTDGEPFQFLFGNPTRNTGAFYESCFGRSRDKYLVRVIDSRDVRFTNKDLIEEWIKEYGEDSDFVRVRVRGLPPSASDAQFIDATRVYAAQKRQVMPLPDEPIIAGVDVSGGGGAWTVCAFRKGLDGRSRESLRLSGEDTRDRTKLVSLLAEVLSEDGDRKVAAMFVDSAFGSPVVERLHALGFKNVHEVNFGGPSPDIHQANQRAYQWQKMKEWLLRGTIRRDNRLEADLTGPGFHLNTKDQLVIESKDSMTKRGLASPDDGDALSLTFAQNVGVFKRRQTPQFAVTSTWAGV
jgi:hypothetical protein